MTDDEQSIADEVVEKALASDDDNLGKAYSIMEEVFDYAVGETVVLKSDYDEVESMPETHLKPSFQTYTIAERLLQQCHGGEQFQYKLVGNHQFWFPAMALRSWGEFKKLLIENKKRVDKEYEDKMADFLVQFELLRNDVAKLKEAQRSSDKPE